MTLLNVPPMPKMRENCNLSHPTPWFIKIINFLPGLECQPVRRTQSIHSLCSFKINYQILNLLNSFQWVKCLCLCICARLEKYQKTTCTVKNPPASKIRLNKCRWPEKYVLLRTYSALKKKKKIFWMIVKK